MKWRNSKERELLAAGGSREQTLPNKNNPHPDLSDADGDKSKLDLTDVNDISPAGSPNSVGGAPRLPNDTNPTTGGGGDRGGGIPSYPGDYPPGINNYHMYEAMDYESSNDSEEEINVT